MLTQLTSALVRAMFVATLIMTPSVLLSSATSDSQHFVMFLAILAASMVFIEYYGRSPSFIEFRFAPPFNRLKVTALAICLLSLSLIMQYAEGAPDFIVLLKGFGAGLGDAVDFPYSPVRLMVIMLPHDASPELTDTMQTAAGVAYTCSIAMVLTFVILVRFFGWPSRSGAFNVWTNLPLFDPTGGGDVLARLKRDAALNIVIGALLPFIIPAAVKAAAGLLTPLSLRDPQTLIWMVTIWAFLPASLLMRGIAMSRIAELIEEKRRRAYAEAGHMQRA